MGVSFVDNFDGLDEARWFVSDGWTNGSHQNCTWSRDRIRVQDGMLHVGFASNKGGRAAAGPVSPENMRPLSCGEVQTRAVFGYGTYEVRLRTPKGSGLNANMFTFIGPVHQQPHDEIDFEFLLKDTGTVQLNSYVSAKGGNEYLAHLPTAADADFADYAFVWEPGRIRWFIDGRQVHEVAGPEKVPTHESKIYLSLWGTDTLTDWLGPFDPPAGPIAMEVDRIAFTAAGEACQFEGSLACEGLPLDEPK